MRPTIAVNPRFHLIDETDDWLVVDKPAPLQIHPSTPGKGPTLWDGLRGLLAYELTNGGQVSIINRLDRETSGLVLIAKNKVTARRFGLAMQRRQMDKTYWAVVHGWPDWQSIRVEAPILRQGEVEPSAVWVKQRVHPNGNPSATRFEVMERWTTDLGPVSRIQAHPETGRMHQIRVHLAHLGHPIVGDKIYGRDPNAYLEFIETGWTANLQERLGSVRHLLHSATLSVHEPDVPPLRWVSALPSDWAP